MKQSTIEEIVESERQLVLTASDRYGEYYAHAHDATVFLSSFLKSIGPDQEIFLRFVSQVKKHHTLSVLSLVRLHKIQAMLNLRQALEAGACACYAVHNPNHKDFVDIDDQGFMNPSQKLTSMRYKWLDEHFPKGSADIKRIKDNINSFSAHANLINTTHNFSLAKDQSWATAPFFDIEDEHLIKTDLWLTANVAIGLLNFFFSLTDGVKGIIFVDNFHQRFNRLADENQKLCSEMKSTDRYKQAMLLKN